MWICVEFYGEGDAFFGGKADDRALGVDGSFLTKSYGRHEVARFPSREAALAAGDAAPNRRTGGLLGSWEESS